MIREIITPADPRLRKKSKKIKKLDKKIKSIIKDLYDTLDAQKDPEGVGLAAPQIGKNVQIFLMKFSKEDAKAHGEKSRSKIVINPKITHIKELKKKEAKKRREILEGCLSLPYFYGPLIRNEEVTIKYLDEEGNKQEQTFKGFPAQVVLHEIDHLNGTLFVDRLLEQGKPLYELKDEKWYEVDLG